MRRLEVSDFRNGLRRATFPIGGGVFIDIYNQMYNKAGIAGTIHTRINDGGYWWVTQVIETE